MISIQEDLIFFYNEMTKYSSELPIGVKYNIENKTIQFRQYSKTSNFSVLNNYCKSLRNLTDTTALLPSDYITMMNSLKSLINSGKLINERVLVSPEKYGFSVFLAEGTAPEFGPLEVSKIRIISSNWWLFRKIMKIRYKLIIV